MSSILPTTPEPARSTSDFAVELFYDGDCPLCMREVRLMRRLDKAGVLRLTDLHTVGSDDVEGRSFEALMARMHGRLRDGRWVTGVEVFRQAYAAVGFRRLVAISRLPGVRQLLDLAYHVFAKNRLRLTGRCDEGRCEVPRRRARRVDGALADHG